MARINVDTITNRNNSGAPSLTFGASFPSGSKLTVNGDVNLTGVSTVGFVTSLGANIAGILTAAQFIGDGSGLIAIPSVSSGKSIALKIILDPLPFRS